MASLLAGAMVVWPMATVGSFEAVLALAILLGLASGGALTLCYTIGGLVVGRSRTATTAFGFFSAAALFGGAFSPSVAGPAGALGPEGDLRRGRRDLRRLAVALAAAPRPSRRSRSRSAR